MDARAGCGAWDVDNEDESGVVRERLLRRVS